MQRCCSLDGRAHMCNGWRHSPSCTCGWGGEGRGDARRNVAGQASLFSSFESYTNPNAACPVCGEQVFFYRSPNGGAVFFDELGPPWPKHPCTDHRRQTVSGQRIGQATASRRPSWLDAGWSPLLNGHATDVNPRLMRLEADLKQARLSLYLPKVQLQTFRDASEALCDSPILSMEDRPGVYRVELLGPAGKVITALAFESTVDALNHADELDRRRPVRLTNASRVRKGQ